MITRRIARPSCRRRIIQISALSTFDVKKLVVGLWVGSAGPPSGVCTGLLVPSVGDALLALIGRVCDALRCSGPHARYTDVFNEYIALADRPGKSLKFHRDGDRSLQLLVFNEEFLVSASHQLALTTSPALFAPKAIRAEGTPAWASRIASPPNHASLIGTHGIGGGDWSPGAYGAVGLKLESPSVDARLVVVEKTPRIVSCVVSCEGGP
ncbi:hypothetical protein L1887_52416 [Cichorium endivia]|nr:hypothetical protein L1887_52416 [Cichorium endivia]